MVVFVRSVYMFHLAHILRREELPEMTGPAKELDTSGAGVGHPDDETKPGLAPAKWARLKLDGIEERFPLAWYLLAGGRRYMWQCLKNCIKLPLGRGLYRDDSLVFFRRYILHLVGLRRIWAITSVTDRSSEGAGSQAFLTMRTINWARASGLQYLHTPFTNIFHADRPMQEWAAAWEALFNLGAGEEPCNGRRRGVIENSCVVLPLELCFGLDHREQELLSSFRALIPEFRRKYYFNKSPRTADPVTVAVHIRRGDVSAEISQMYTSTERVTQIVSAVKSMLNSKAIPHCICVYSQGPLEEFEDLRPLGAEFFLDADPIWTIQELVEADILIVAKSYFSYYAGMISDGIKIYEPHFWPGQASGIPQLPGGGLHGPQPTWRHLVFSELDDWLPCQAGGSFDRTAFERQLAWLLQEKKKARTTGSAPAGT
jgi:hypothetical protein